MENVDKIANRLKDAIQVRDWLQCEEILNNNRNCPMILKYIPLDRLLWIMPPFPEQLLYLLKNRSINSEFCIQRMDVYNHFKENDDFPPEWKEILYQTYSTDQILAGIRKYIEKFDLYNADIRTCLTILKINRNSYSYFSEFLKQNLENWQKIALNLQNLEDVKRFSIACNIFLNFITYTRMLKPHLLEKKISILDVGTNGKTSNLLLLGLNWIGFSNDPLLQIDLHNLFRINLPESNENYYIQQPFTTQTKIPTESVSLSYISRTLHHLNSNNMDLNKISQILYHLYEITEDRLIIIESLIIEAQKDNIFDTDGSRYLTVNEFMNIPFISENREKIIFDFDKKLLENNDLNYPTLTSTFFTVKCYIDHGFLFRK